MLQTTAPDIQNRLENRPREGSGAPLTVPTRLLKADAPLLTAGSSTGADTSGAERSGRIASIQHWCSAAVQPSCSEPLRVAMARALQQLHGPSLTQVGRESCWDGVCVCTCRPRHTP